MSIYAFEEAQESKSCSTYSRIRGYSVLPCTLFTQKREIK